MDWVEVVGYAGTGLTFAAWGMRDAITLRVFGIASSLAFLSFGLLSATWPVVATELALLPLNGWRLWQLTRGRNGDADERNTWLMAHGREEQVRRGAPIVRAGEAARSLTVVPLPAGPALVGDARPFRRVAESRTLHAPHDLVVVRIDLGALEAAGARDPELARRLVGLALAPSAVSDVPDRRAA